MSNLTAIVSIHDVTAQTLPRVRKIITILEHSAVGPVTLLVVPDGGWTAAGLHMLRRLVRKDHIHLAGHGWRHQSKKITSAYHKLHSLLLSRDVAEHLALTRMEAENLVRRCYLWFEKNGLPTPSLYVPPTWAMGPLDRRALVRLPFRFYESYLCVFDSRSQQAIPLYLNGWEADTRLRQTVLTLFNGVNRRLAKITARPMRIGIHPHDFDYRLAADLERLLRMPHRYISYSDLFDDV